MDDGAGPSRRTLLRGVAAASLATPITTAVGAITPSPAWDHDGCAKFIAAYDGQGLHRTGLPGDADSAKWLAGLAATTGADVSLEGFDIERIEPDASYIEIGSQRIDGVPLFDALPTSRQGVAGRLGPPGASISVAELGPLIVYAPSFAALRRTPGIAGLVIVTKGGEPGLALLNAEEFLHPYGPPVLQVSSDAADRLAQASAAGAMARLVVDGRRVPAHPVNVVASIEGRTRGRPPLVVMTPRSGWWQSTSERAGGLACWLALLRAAASERPATDMVFVASSGHELGHIGLDAFMARRPEWTASATWLHFGANIGARGGKLTLQSASDDLRALGQTEMAAAGEPIAELSPRTQAPFGEARAIHHAGGRYLTLVGSNPLFHLPQDRWPDAVDTDVVLRCAAAFTRIAAALAGG